MYMADASQNQSSISGQVRSIAEAAIHSINQLTSLIENRPSTVPDASANSRTSNTLGPSTPRLTTNTALESPRLVLNQAAAVNVQRRQTSALTELRRRFPTVSGRARESSGRYVSTNRSSSSLYISTATRRRVGRPTTK